MVQRVTLEPLLRLAVLLLLESSKLRALTMVGLLLVSSIRVPLHRVLHRLANVLVSEGEGER